VSIDTINQTKPHLKCRESGTYKRFNEIFNDNKDNNTVKNVPVKLSKRNANLQTGGLLYQVYHGHTLSYRS
jgi:hypothetical protein